RRVAAGQGFLVADDVQQGALLRAQRDQALLGRNEEQGPQDGGRRFAHDLRPSGRTEGPGAARELASRAQGRRLLALLPMLLARGSRYQRQVDAAGGGEGAMTSAADGAAPAWMDARRSRRRNPFTEEDSMTPPYRFPIAMLAAIAVLAGACKQESATP